MTWVYSRIGRHVSPYIFVGLLHGARLIAFLLGWAAVCLSFAHPDKARWWLLLALVLWLGTWLSKSSIVTYQQRLFRCLRWFVTLPSPDATLVFENAPPGLQQYMRRRVWWHNDTASSRGAGFYTVKQVNKFICAELDALVITQQLRLEGDTWVFEQYVSPSQERISC